jgi:hypothetical protein
MLESEHLVSWLLELELRTHDEESFEDVGPLKAAQGVRFL